MVETRFGSILAEYMSIYAVGLYVCRLHPGNQTSVYRPREWYRFAIYIVGRLQSSVADPRLFGASGSGDGRCLCKALWLDIVVWSRQTLFVSLYRDIETSWRLHIWCLVYGFTVSFFSFICHPLHTYCSIFCNCCFVVVTFLRRIFACVFFFLNQYLPYVFIFLNLITSHV